MFDIMSFFKKSKSSKDVAKERLQLVLVNDRVNCSPDVMENIRKDILDVIKKHLDIDEQNLDIKISNEEDEQDAILIANIPIKNMKR